mmetsp:Transcript_19025/g.55946  ORF Transcript_19025/g.55946 Transcript_19025/m.55946 type:complete len:91 (-) Transcript_19025:1126-1398(-)
MGPDGGGVGGPGCVGGRPKCLIFANRDQLKRACGDFNHTDEDDEDVHLNGRLQRVHLLRVHFWGRFDRGICFYGSVAALRVQCCRVTPWY